jgi:hypothetical protein
MRANLGPIAAATLVLGVLLTSEPVALAQQTTGAPGSSNATTTIDGHYLPPPPQPFQGEINLNTTDAGMG